MPQIVDIPSPVNGSGEPRVRVLIAGNLGYDMYRPDEAPRPVNSTATLIQVAGRTVLVDPGMDNEALLAGLKEADVAPEAVDTVVITHAHGDHYKSVHLLPNARVVASGPEVHAWRSRGAPDKELLERLRPTPTAIAPGVKLVLTAGHTPGSATVLVAQAGQVVAIVGDAVDSRDFFLRREPSHNTQDAVAERRNFELFAAIADVIVPGHGRPFRLHHGATGEEL